jgi:hypothetical protein
MFLSSRTVIIPLRFQTTMFMAVRFSLNLRRPSSLRV